MAGRWLLATSLVVLIAARSMAGQTRPAFNAASIQLSPYPNASADLFTPPDSPIIITNYTLRALVSYAYGLKSRHELAGVPDSLLYDKFVIKAVPPPGTPAAQIPMMVQQLLADRFQLRLKREEGALPVWALELNQADGGLGPQLAPSKYDCKPFLTPVTASSPDAPRGEDGLPACSSVASVSSLDGASFKIKGVPIGELVRRIDTSDFTGLDRPVIDRTALTGNYDIKLAFAAPAWSPPFPQQTAPPIDVAVKEQLGLKLASRTAPRMRYVIESVERPILD